jgi:hypothetical protein
MVAVGAGMSRQSGVAIGTGYGSNMLASVTAKDTRCQEWNVWKVVTFDWTSGVSMPTIGSFPLLKTNVQKL